MADKLPKINPNISKYKNDLGLSTANVDAMQNMATVPSNITEVNRNGYLNNLKTGDLLTKGVSNFLDGTPYNVLHDFNSYNYIWTLYSLSKEQVADPSTYVGKVFSNDKYWGYENSSFYTILRSGGYARTSAESASAQANEVNLGSQQAQMLAEQDAEFFEDDLAEADPNCNKSGLNKQVDLFIDNVNIENFMGNSPEGIGNLAKGSFSVTEPYGVGGFYEELANAARFAGHENYTGAPFLLTLSFIGRKAGQDDPEIVSKGTRYWPIMIKRSKMKVTESGSTYQVEFAGQNAEAGKGFSQTTKERIAGPDYFTPTVGRILLHTFQKHNEKIESNFKDAQGKWKGEEAKVPENIAGGTPASPYIPDRYCIWFPKSYGTAEDSGFDPSGTTQYTEEMEDGDTWVGEFTTGSGEDFPSDLKSLSYDAWKSYSTGNLLEADRLTKVDNLAGEPGSGSGESEKETIPLSQYSNYISSAKMQDGEQSGTGVYYVDSIQKPIDDANEKLAAAIKELNNKKAEAAKFKGEAEVKEGDLKALVEKVYKIDGKFDKTKLTDAQLKDYNAKTKEIEDLKSKAGKAESEVKKAQKNVEVAQQGKNTAEQPKAVKLFGTHKQSWSFKKGISLESIIHQIVLDSTYSKIFTQQEKWSKILGNGMIPWYRIEKFAKIIGFDTARNAPAYEYHYIIVPFQVHYSKLPNANAPLKYSELKKFSVRDYNYIFTGKNLDIMSFDIDYNNLFFVPIDFSKPNVKKTNPNNPETSNEISDPFNDVPTCKNNLIGSPQNQLVDQTENDNGAGKATANSGTTARALHDRLYNNTSDLLTAQLEIVGDPVYLVSSGITNRPKISSYRKVETALGEVNTFDREATINLNIAFPGGAETSGADIPNSAELAQGKYALKVQNSKYSGLYRVTKVLSRFDGGQFVQTLQLARYPNQENDYEVATDIREPTFVEAPDPKAKPSPQEEIDKAVKEPEVKLDGEAAKNLETTGGFGGTENLTKLGSVAIGGLAGFALGGPIGAVAGAAVGGNTNFLQSVTDAIGSGTSIPVPGDAKDAVSIAQAAETVTQNSNIVDDD